MIDVKEFFSDLKERISSPFITAFILSWLVHNWKVPVGIIFEKNDELKNDGFRSPIHLVESYNSWWNFFWYPLIVAIIITILLPVIKAGVVVLNAWFKKLEKRYVRKVSNNSNIPIERYLKLLDAYESDSKKLQKLITDESPLTEQNRSLKTQSAMLQSQLNDATTEVNGWNQGNTVHYLNGGWLLTYNSEFMEKLIFINGEVFGEDREYRYTIKYYFFNFNTRALTFTSFNERVKRVTYFLKANDDLSLLEGRDENNGNIIFRKEANVEYR